MSKAVHSNRDTSKLKTTKEIPRIIASLKKMGKKVVFTNGCFDMLHVGHVRYLRQAKALGDVLVIGLNRDSSVKGLKGSGRPVTNETQRAEVLSALDAVDYIVLFGERTPEKLIHIIQPDFLVKGGDWKKEDIVGASFVESYGGKVLPLRFVDGYSTTNLIERIKRISR